MVTRRSLTALFMVRIHAREPFHSLAHGAGIKHSPRSVSWQSNILVNNLLNKLPLFYLGARSVQI